MNYFRFVIVYAHDVTHIKSNDSRIFMTSSYFHKLCLPPMKWGDILFLAPLSVCPSVCLSVCLSVCPSRFRVRSISFDETMCSAYVWPRSVQGQGHNLRLNIVWLYFVSALYLWTPGGFYKLFCTNVSYDGTMCSAYVWPRSVQGKCHSLRFNIVWLYFSLYLLNPWWD